MFDAASRTVFHSLAQVEWLQKLASEYGMAAQGGFARRFIAGETIDEAVVAVRGLQARGLLLTLDYLGESVSTLDAASEATRDYLQILDAIVRSGIERNISLKLTQLGLDVDRATCIDNLRRILEPADANGFFVRIDMEGSSYTEATIQVLETLWKQGHRSLGTVLQSYLLRTDADIARVLALGARIRLVKGAYNEPRELAIQEKADVDAAFARQMKVLLDAGHYPAIATHDPAMIEETKRYAVQRGYARDRFEFQMLYGVRRDLQTALHAEGYRMRIYVPFGKQWFPYFMRRLGERPANIWFVARSVVSERS